MQQTSTEGFKLCSAICFNGKSRKLWYLFTLMVFRLVSGNSFSMEIPFWETSRGTWNQSDQQKTNFLTTWYHDLMLSKFHDVHLHFCIPKGHKNWGCELLVPPFCYIRNPRGTSRLRRCRVNRSILQVNNDTIMDSIWDIIANKVVGKDEIFWKPKSPKSPLRGVTKSIEKASKTPNFSGFVRFFGGAKNGERMMICCFFWLFDWGNHWKHPLRLAAGFVGVKKMCVRFRCFFPPQTCHGFLEHLEEEVPENDFENGEARVYLVYFGMWVSIDSNGRNAQLLFKLT